jgi:hypothetical protein
MMSAGTRHTLTNRDQIDRAGKQMQRSTITIDDEPAETPDQGFLRAFECGVRHGHIVFMPVEVDGTGILADIACEERPAPRLPNSASLSVNRHKS